MLFAAAFSSASLLSATLVLLLLPWYIRARSVPGLVIVGWLVVVNIIYGLNAVVWDGDSLLRARAYCDIVTKLFIGMQVAVPTAVLCLAMQIKRYVVGPDTEVNGKLGVRWRLLEAAICIFGPLIYMALHIAAQDHRFDVVQDVGCLPSASPTVPALLILWLVPLFPLAGIIVFEGVILNHIVHVESYMSLARALAVHLVWSSAPFGLERLCRMFAMTLATLTWALSLSLSALIIYAETGITWFHEPDFLRVDVFPSLSEYPTYLGPVHWLVWSGPVYAILFFLASVEKDTWRVYVVYYNQIVYGRSVLFPDNNPGVNLAELSPIPPRRSRRRRRVTKSCQYDPPRLVHDFDASISEKTQSPHPPTPLTPTPVIQEPKPTYTGYRISVFSQPLERMNPRRAMKEYAKIRDKRPLYTIPESPVLDHVEPMILYFGQLQPLSREERDQEKFYTAYAV